MPDDSVQFSLLVGRLRAGDAAAREELIRTSLGRLERLARKMLRRFPPVKRWEDTGDVLQLALIRLDCALRDIAPPSSKAFFGLAAEQVRRVLLDLARHYQGAHGMGTHQDRAARVGDPGIDASDDSPAWDELDRWAAFHAAVEKLPVAEREVFMLTFYQDWTQVQIADLFGVDERTVRRRWQSATALLRGELGRDLPEA